MEGYRRRSEDERFLDSFTTYTSVSRIGNTEDVGGRSPHSFGKMHRGDQTSEACLCDPAEVNP